VADSYNGLRIISIIDPEYPEEVGYFDTDGHVYGVAVSGNYAYLADFWGGLRVISVNDPEHPEEVGYCLTSGLAVDVAVSGDYAYVADEHRGLIIISVVDPEHPEEVGYYDTPGSANGVALSEDGLIYVADYTNLGIYRFTDPVRVDDKFKIQNSTFKIFTAYPNPFNSTTTITYALPARSNINLNIYNIRGQLVDVLLDRIMPAGRHSVVWDGSDLSAGLYFLRMEDEKGRIGGVQKVVLVK